MPARGLLAPPRSAAVVVAMLAVAFLTLLSTGSVGVRGLPADVRLMPASHGGVTAGTRRLQQSPPPPDTTGAPSADSLMCYPLADMPGKVVINYTNVETAEACRDRCILNPKCQFSVFNGSSPDVRRRTCSLRNTPMANTSLPGTAGILPTGGLAIGLTLCLVRGNSAEGVIDANGNPTGKQDFLCIDGWDILGWGYGKGTFQSTLKDCTAGCLNAIECDFFVLQQPTKNSACYLKRLPFSGPYGGNTYNTSIYAKDCLRVWKPPPNATALSCWFDTDIMGVPVAPAVNKIANNNPDCMANCLNTPGCTFSVWDENTGAKMCYLRTNPFVDTPPSNSPNGTLVAGLNGLNRGLVTCAVRGNNNAAGLALNAQPKLLCQDGWQVAGDLVADPEPSSTLENCANKCLALAACQFFSLGSPRDKSTCYLMTSPNAGVARVTAANSSIATTCLVVYSADTSPTAAPVPPTNTSNNCTGSNCGGGGGSNDGVDVGVIVGSVVGGVVLVLVVGALAYLYGSRRSAAGMGNGTFLSQIYKVTGETKTGPCATSAASFVSASHRVAKVDKAYAREVKRIEDMREELAALDAVRTDDPALQAAIYRVLSKLRDCEDIAKNLERQAREGQVKKLLRTPAYQQTVVQLTGCIDAVSVDLDHANNLLRNKVAAALKANAV